MGFKPTCFYTEGESRITGPENFFITTLSKIKFCSLHFLEKTLALSTSNRKKVMIKFEEIYKTQHVELPDTFATGKAIAAMRRQLGVKQQDLARKCGMTGSKLSSIEMGRCKIYPELIQRVLRGLNFYQENQEKVFSPENRTLLD